MAGWTLAVGVRVWPPSVALEWAPTPDPEPEAVWEPEEPDPGGQASVTSIVGEVTDTSGLMAARHIGYR
jgi:hypothetical protein